LRRRIEIIGSDILRRRSRDVDPSGERDFLSELIRDMEAILEEEEGLGLAAPQAGESLRVFLLESSSLPVGGHRVFVNPVLTPSGSLVKREEGCLSVPGVYEDVTRPSCCRVEALDELGRPFALDLEGLAARAAQHENDHLDGVLFVDRLSPLKKRLIRRKLASLSQSAGHDPGEAGTC
jgi:peptide deformylase